MKHIFVLLCLIAASRMAVAQKTVYTTTGGEWIFSSAGATMGGVNANTVVRFSPVFNFQNQVHRDFSATTGIFTGFSIRNVGFIYDDPTNSNTRYKSRSYNFGIPIALKYGKMDGRYVFAGYELEIPFNYKEKKFVNNDKVDKFNDWFSARTPAIYHTVFAGIQFPEGMQLKFKYYLTNWFNKGYTTLDSNGTPVQPYANMNVNIFYVSLTFQILKGSSFYYKHKSED